MRKTTLFCLIIIAGIFVAPPPASAATITVNTTDDELNNDGDCSLREAIQAANLNAVVDACPDGSPALLDTITLANGATYNLTLTGSGENANASGDFDILDNTAIPDINFTVASGGTATLNANTDRILEGQGNASIGMNNIILQNGTTSSDGGAIYMQGGALTLTNTTFMNNTATNGGAVSGAASSQLLTITGSTFTNNMANNSGGALFLNSPFSISTSTFTSNSAASSGGAIFNQNASGTQSIQTTTFATNLADTGGGITNTSGALTIARTTLNGNSANLGGAIYLTNSGSSLALQESTLSGNTASTDGRAIYSDTATAGSTVLNSTITSNSGSGSTLVGLYTLQGSIISGTCAGTVTDGGNNIAYPTACGAIIVGNDPLLGALANNGGSTKTHLLASGSSAINGYSGCSGTDQRGIARPQTGSCDIGSVEMRAFEIFTPTPSNTPTATSTYTPTPTASDTPTNTRTPSETATDTFTPTATPTHTLTASDTPTNTRTPSETATDTLTPTATPTHTPTASDTVTNTATSSATATFTTLPDTNTATHTLTPTATATTTFTPTNTATPTASNTLTLIPTCAISVVPPGLIAPLHRSHTTDTTPRFQWQSVNGAQSYRLMIYLEDRSFIFKKRLFVNDYILETPLVPAQYLWRVRTQDTICSTWSAWSKRNTLFIDN